MAMVPRKAGRVEMHFTNAENDRLALWAADGSIRFEVQDATGAKVDADLAPEDAEAVAMHLHLVERNRLMRAGQQWIASIGGSPWREPPKPKESTRAVYNMLGPALDFRLQVMADQRPGFTMSPTTGDPHLDPAAVQVAPAPGVVIPLVRM